MIDQPEPQYYFHRPLSLLLKPAFAAGFVLDGIEEPVFAPPSEGKGSLSQHVYSDMPAALVARLHLLPYDPNLSIASESPPPRHS
jgi:hypothetical protein